MGDDDNPDGGPLDGPDGARRDTGEDGPRPNGGSGVGYRDDQPDSQRGPDPASRREESERAGWKLYAYDLFSSVAIVVLIGALLFAASGIWPPMVAVESPSMEPVLQRGDLVYLMDAHRFPGPGAHGDTGVVPANTARKTGYRKLDGYGDVIVYEPGGDEHRTPIIHRAMFWVEDGENWLDKANPAYLPENAVCDPENGNGVPSCPAPHAGFITKGDNNGGYDQVSGVVQSGPIKPSWVVGTAEVHVPYLGQIRLESASATAGNATAGNGTLASAARAGT